MLRQFVLLLALCCLALPETLAQKRRAVKLAQPPATGAPLRGLSPSLLARFEGGRLEFNRQQQVDDGLGPVHNGRSCNQCHSIGGSGGGSIGRITRFGVMTNKGFDPLTSLGGPTLQMEALSLRLGSPHEFSPELIPSEATVVVQRRAPPLFGLGLVDATPDATFVALAAEQAARNDGTAGRVAMVDNAAAGMKTAGKFGWKAQNPTLFQFAGEAYLNELGITNPFFPNEHCPNGRCEDLQFNPQPGLNDDGSGTQALTDFMTLLAPPPRAVVTKEAIAGEAVFNRIGCNSCHVSTLQTGPNENPALDRVTYHPYSDFLLHDMGPLGDGMPQGAAIAREMRTPPLWGLRLLEAFIVPALLHDSRAGSIEGAILGHDGQGRAARDRFLMLREPERGQLLAFLRSL